MTSARSRARQLRCWLRLRPFATTVESMFPIGVLDVLSWLQIPGRWLEVARRRAEGLQVDVCPFCNSEALWETEETFGIFKTLWKCDHCDHQEHRDHRRVGKEQP